MSNRSEGFPLELRKALKALSNETREHIFLNLTEEGDSYTELLRRTNIQKGSLTHHLKTLMSAGLVRNFSRGKIQGAYDSFYAKTGFGESLVAGILGGVEPPVGYLDDVLERVATTFDRKFILTVPHREKRIGELSEGMACYTVASEYLSTSGIATAVSPRSPASPIPIPVPR